MAPSPGSRLESKGRGRWRRSTCHASIYMPCRRRAAASSTMPPGSSAGSNLLHVVHISLSPFTQAQKASSPLGIVDQRSFSIFQVALARSDMRRVQYVVEPLPPPSHLRTDANVTVNREAGCQSDEMQRRCCCRKMGSSGEGRRGNPIWGSESRNSPRSLDRLSVSLFPSQDISTAKALPPPLHKES